MQGPGAGEVWSRGAIHCPYWASKSGMRHPLLPEEHENITGSLPWLGGGGGGRGIRALSAKPLASETKKKEGMHKPPGPGSISTSVRHRPERSGCSQTQLGWNLLASPCIGEIRSHLDN